MISAKTLNDKIVLYHHKQKFNCAQTTLKILSGVFDVDICPQVIVSAAGLNGGGRYGAQCGLLEGALMFMGIKAKIEGKDKKFILDKCYNYTDKFNKKFKSLLCKDLRPEGFKPGQTPAVCEKLFKDTTKFAISYINKEFK